MISFNIDNLHDVGLVGGVFFVTVDTHDLLARFNHVQLLCDFDASCNYVIGSLIAVNLEAPNTAGNLQLFDNN